MNSPEKSFQTTVPFRCQACGKVLPAYCLEICPECRKKRQGVEVIPRHPGDLVAEKYRLVRPLGHGGMGEVWLAVESHTWRDNLRAAPAPEELLAVRENPASLSPLLERLDGEIKRLGKEAPGLLFAIKFTKLRQVEGLMLERFREECRQLARLRDPHIAQVKDATLEDRGEPLLVMEYVDGEKLTSYCDRKRLSIPQRLDLFLDVCRGVRHAHERGVEHRDLKPANILVTEVGGEPMPKLIDFGLATDQEQKRSQWLSGRDPSAFAGTLAYASPEQLRGERDLDARTDVYALGVILYQLLVGSVPVTPSEVCNMLTLVRREALEMLADTEPPPMEKRLSETTEFGRLRIARRRASSAGLLAKELRLELGDIIAKALERDPEQRIGSVPKLMEHVHEYLDGRPSSLRPRTWSYVTQKFLRRHAKPVAAVMAVGLISAVYTYSVVRERDQTKEARYLAEDRLYNSDMMLVGRNLSEGRPANARTLLARHRVEPSGRDLRDWEWYMLNGEANVDLMRVDAHQGSLNGLSVSPDGKLIATISGSGDVAIWDTLSLKLRMRWSAYKDRGKNRGWRVAWNAAGDRLATASGNGIVRVWDVSSDTPPSRPIVELVLPDVKTGNAVETIAWEPISGSHARLAIGGRHREILLWTPDAELSNSPIHFLEYDESAPSYLGNIPEISNPQILGYTKYGTAALCWSSDGKKIGAGVFAAGDTTIVIDVTTGNLLAGWPAHSGNDIFSVAFNSTNDEIVAGSKHLYVSAYKIGNMRPVFDSPVHKGFVTAVACEPGGTRVASGSYDGTICINDPDDPESAPEVLAGHTDKIEAIAWAKVPVRTGTRNILFSCSSDGTLRAWRAENSKGELFSEGDLGWISEARWNADSSKLAVSTFGNPISVFDREIGNMHLVPLDTDTYPFDVAWSPDGQRLALGQMHTDSVRVIDSASGHDLAVFHLNRARRVAWSPDGRYLAGGSRNEVLVWDTQTKDPKPVCTIRQSGARITWNRDGRRLAIGTYEGAVEIWDGLNGTCLSRLRPVQPPTFDELYVENEPTRMVADLAWAPSKDELAFVTGDSVAAILDARTGATLQQFIGHTGEIDCLAWSPTGTRLATGGADGTVRLYDVSTGDEVVRVPHGTGCNEISALDWSADGYSLASAGFDGYVYAWDSRRGRDLDTIDELEDQLARDPHKPAIRLELATLCARTGLASRARDLADQAQALNPGDPSIIKIRDEIETTLASIYETKCTPDLMDGNKIRAAQVLIPGSWISRLSAIVGVWRWLPRDQEVTINRDGTCSSNYHVTGQWGALDTKPLTFLIQWDNGFVDTLLLSPDGTSLTGSNQGGPHAAAFLRIK